jgi:hypothetical protein
MKDDGDDWRDQKFGGHITCSAFLGNGYLQVTCPCGWQRIAGNTDKANTMADRHERRAGGRSWFRT